MELQKNVPSTPLEDVKWALNYTDACIKAVADTVKRLQIRMDFLEQDMAVVLRLTKEISSLKEIVMNKKKEEEEEDADIPYKKQRKLVENKLPQKKNKEKSFLLRE